MSYNKFVADHHEHKRLLFLGRLVVYVFIPVVIFFYYPIELNQTLSTIKDDSVRLASFVLQHDFRSVKEIKTHYEDIEKKVQVLLVPGHEPNYGGSEYRNLIERDMNVQLADDLKKFLEQDTHYKVVIARDTEDWNPLLKYYFENNWLAIKNWTDESLKEFSKLVELGITKKTVSTVKHNKANATSTNYLFGISKWSNENGIDIIIHIHFNDVPRSYRSSPGKYSGFAIYVPASQYGNSTSTKAIANKIFERLSKYHAVSDLPGESGGLIDEPQLIAIGAYNTSDAASMLIEYSYIYEPQFQDRETKNLEIRDLAYATYLGLQDFFNSKILRDNFGTKILPYEWPKKIDEDSPTKDIFILQTALTYEGQYPPDGKNKNTCPRSGNLGPCTKEALKNFQLEKEISGEQGFAGTKTIQEFRNDGI